MEQVIYWLGVGATTHEFVGVVLAASVTSFVIALLMLAAIGDDIDEADTARSVKKMIVWAAVIAVLMTPMFIFSPSRKAVDRITAVKAVEWAIEEIGGLK